MARSLRIATGCPKVCEVCDTDVEEDLTGPEVLCPRCRKMADEVVARVCEIMAVNPDVASIRTRFKEIDSVVSCELLADLEDRYRFSFRERPYYELDSIGDLVRLILIEKGEL